MAKRRRSEWRTWAGTLLALVAVLCCVLGLVRMAYRSGVGGLERPSRAGTPTEPACPHAVPSHDVAVMNLRCAQGLPGRGWA